MTSDNESDQTIVINDLLSFVSCKRKLFKQHIILKSIQEFYSKEEAIDALKTLLTALPSELVPDFQISLNENPFLSILIILKNSSINELPIFVCKDLNNVPKIEASVLNEYNKYSFESKKEFYTEHHKIKSQLKEVFSSLHELRDQFQLLNKEENGIFSLDDEEDEDGIDYDNNGYERGTNSPMKDLAYFQNLITEKEEKEESEDDNFTDDTRDILDQHINLLASKYKRELLKTVSKSLEGKNEKPKTPVSLLSPKQKVIHIGMDEAVSVLDSVEQWNENSDDDDVAHEAEIEINSSPLKSSKSENCQFLICENQFDEIMGNITLFRCSSCEFCSNEESTALDHTCVKVSYKPRVTNGKLLNRREKCKKPYECHSCGSSFRMRRDLQKHIESHMEDGHRCPLCANRFSTEEWPTHVRLCSGDGTTTTTLEDYYCEICDVFYADKRTLSFHKAFHDTSRPFECLECKYRFYTQKSVEDHFRTHKLNRNNKKCPFCDFRASKQTKIVDHIRCHTGDRPYKCSQCEHSCPTFNALKVHLTSHSLTRDFPCDICGKKFKSQSKVASHRKIHTTERPHKCPICGKGFKFGLQMALHHRMHLDIRKHACPHCPYKARTAAILRGHMNTHSQTKPFKCNLCDFGANHKSYLNWHLKYYHPSSQEPQKNSNM